MYFGLLWILWCFYQLFGLSSDGTHSLHKIHWWASHNATFLRLSSDEELIFDGLRVSTFLAKFHFWVNYFFNFMFIELSHS